jgi:hypothetical protein
MHHRPEAVQAIQHQCATSQHNVRPKQPVCDDLARLQCTAVNVGTTWRAYTVIHRQCASLFHNGAQILSFPRPLRHNVPVHNVSPCLKPPMCSVLHYPVTMCVTACTFPTPGFLPELASRPCHSITMPFPTWQQQSLSQTVVSTSNVSLQGQQS